MTQPESKVCIVWQSSGICKELNDIIIKDARSLCDIANTFWIALIFFSTQLTQLYVYVIWCDIHIFPQGFINVKLFITMLDSYRYVAKMLIFEKFVIELYI